MSKARGNYRGGWLELAELWHHDPCKGGSDDSCGRFMRARHGSDEVLKKIVSRYEFDWDRVYTSKREDHDDEDGAFRGETYFQGWFKPDGTPNLSVIGITLNMFWMAAFETFDSRKKADKFIRRNLFEILLFAENTTDSLFDGITMKFEIGCNMVQTPRRRKERIERMASCVYGYIIRKARPWWKSPNLHVHHWRFVFPWFRSLRRLLWDRCCKCRKTLGWNKSVSSDWSGTNLTCYRCERNGIAKTQQPIQ